MERRRGSTLKAYILILLVAEVNHHWGGSEPVRLVADVEDADREPDAADDFGEVGKLSPDNRAGHESEQGQYGVAKYAKGLACRSMNRKLPEACEIHSDERKKCTEVQEFSCMLISAANVVQKHCTPKRQNTDEQDVIRGRAAARL